MKLYSAGANLTRSLLFFAFALGIAACSASPTATPTAEVTRTPLVTIVVATNPPTETSVPATATARVEPITAAANTAVPNGSPVREPTVETTRVPPTQTRPPATATRVALAPTRVPATATRVPPTVTRVPTTSAPPTAAPPTVAPAPTDVPQPTVEPTLPPAPPAPPASFQPTELRGIPEGVLRMGTNNNADPPPDQKPQHDVHMGPYAIERFEVTNAQYDACVQAGACTRAGARLNGDNFPVVNVTWTQADAYCKWVGRRLPNEAEWERAARGMDNWEYTWSNSIGMHFEWDSTFHGSPLSFCEKSCARPHYIDDVNDGFPTTAPVGAIGFDNSKGFDVQDMNGNVSEWVSNWYDGSAYQQGFPVDVFGPEQPTGAKVYRGGSWATEPVRLGTRGSLAPNAARDDLGFRCAQ